MSNDVYPASPGINLSIPGGVGPRMPAQADKQGSGMLRILKDQNTLYEQLRGPLLADGLVAMTATVPILQYRVRIPGNGGGLVSEPCLVFVNGTVPVGGSLEVDVTSSIETKSNAFNIPSTDAWEGLGPTIAIRDDQEFETLDVEVTAISGAGAQLNAIMIGYERARSALTANVYDSGYVAHTTSDPLSRAAHGAHVSARRLHVMHDDARFLYEQRVGSVIQRGFFAPHNIDLDGNFPLIFAAFAPFGVTQARFYIRHSQNGAAGAQSFNIAAINGIGETLDDHDVGTPLPVSATWTSAIDLNAQHGLNVFAITGSRARFHTISGWWKDRSY